MKNWPHIESVVLERLESEDDPALWKTALLHIFKEASFLARCAKDFTVITARVGCCSHWLRPHQTRWTADGGFAWPSGYGGYGFSRHGAPEHDWTIEFYWNVREQEWTTEMPEPPFGGFHSFRVTVPARTARHQQAAIPATWTNGTPVIPDCSVHQIYGFRRRPDGWRCTTTDESGAEHYELAAEHPANRSELPCS